MISSISLQNYKAFSDVTIPLKPLTILLGANSVGKSSILQMIMLLHQTAEERGYKYSSALKIYGNYVNIGAYENLFKGKKTNSPLVLNIEINSSALMEELRDFKKDYIREFQMVCRFFPLRNLWDLATSTINNKKQFSSFVKKVITQINKSGAKDYRPQLLYQLKRVTGISDNDIKNMSYESLLRTYDFLEYLETQLLSDTLKVIYNLSLVENKLIISKFEIATKEEKCLVSMSIDENNKLLVESNIISINDDEQKIIDKYFKRDNTLFDCIISNNMDDTDITPVPFCMFKLLGIVIDSLGDDFSEYKINYVSPLRAHPKRYYMLDKAKMTISLDTLDGDAIAEVLKENDDVKKNVNSWFSKFGFKIDVKGFKEVIHHVNVTQNNLSLDITDVGFGISQVLPIIIQGFLSIDDSITIVEQPEIHLHPMMQADLGDLFIDIIKKQAKKLVIETHSEYLLKRIRRRISEGVISPSMVSICLFHPKTQDKDAWVEHLEIGEKGSFEWPEEFYGGELYNDTIEFLKNQS